MEGKDQRRREINQEFGFSIYANLVPHKQHDHEKSENETDDGDVLDVADFDLVSYLLADTWPGNSLYGEDDAENSNTKEDWEDSNRCVVSPSVNPVKGIECDTLKDAHG